MNRRDFLGTVLAAGAVGLLKPDVRAQTAAPAKKVDDLNVAVIGVGDQGLVLLTALLQIPGLRFKAVCDIWPYNRKRGKNTLSKYGHEANDYTDYGEMLEKEKDLDAVVVATPDFMHAEQSVACLRAGKHVYCEKMMSNTVEGARSMVRAMRETGKLLQIGHQRRSNPRYIFALKRLLQSGELLGRITNGGGQWNRAISGSEDRGWPAKYPVPDDVLKKYGYAGMHEFRNWRVYKRYGGGPISDLGAHQIDIFNWFLGARPTAVMASGGVDYFKNHEWYDNVMAIHEYETPAGAVRTCYQVLTTTSSGGGYFEQFMGINGTLKISENPKLTRVYREAHAPSWDKYIELGYLAGKAEAPEPAENDAGVVDARETAELAAFEIPVILDKFVHQPHLENFFDAIRGRVKLNCPADHAFESEAAVFKVNEAVAAGRKLLFTPEDFAV